MTAPGRYAASDGSFAKSAGSAAARGGILIAIAVVIGFALLAWGFDGGDPDAASGATDTTDDSNDSSDATDDTGDGTDDTGDATDDSGDNTDTGDNSDTGDNTDNGDDTTTTEPVVVDDPSSIRVAVLNGTSTGGLAGERKDTLVALNYVATAGNAVGRPDIEDSKVYFVTGFADEAKLVAEALSGASSVLELAPDDLASLEDGELADAGSAHIIVILGTDNALQ